MNINDILFNNGMSQYALSKKSGVPYSTISDLCLGKTNIRKCNVETAYKIACALDCNMEDLLDVEQRATFDYESEWITKTQYYQSIMKFRKNCILRAESALEYMNITDGYFSKVIKVYALTDLPLPFLVKKVKNFKNLDYSCIDGVLVTSISQSLDDMITDKQDSDMQIFDQALSNYYFRNNKSFDGLKISDKNLETFNYEKDVALSYYEN